MLSSISQKSARIHETNPIKTFRQKSLAAFRNLKKKLKTPISTALWRDTAAVHVHINAAHRGNDKISPKPHIQVLRPGRIDGLPNILSGSGKKDTPRRGIAGTMVKRLGLPHQS